MEQGNLILMNEKYTCPRCGFIFKIELCPDESFRLIRCLRCEKEMSIQNRFGSSVTNKLSKKVHYMHKSLLN